MSAAARGSQESNAVISLQWTRKFRTGGGPDCGHKATFTQDVEGNGQLTAAAHLASAAKRFESME
jgi:hypothetical protein